MKNFVRSVFFLMLAFWGSLAKAQCPNDNILFFTYSAPTTIGASVGSGICIFGGEYYLVNNMVAGNTYRLSSCGSTDIVDTRITVYPNASGGSSVAFNDDFCGTRAQLDFTPETTGSYRILLDQTGPGNTCTSTTSDFSCGEVVVTLISTGPTTAYCTPQYAVGTANGDYINGVTLGSISNLNTGSSTGSSFNDFTNISTALQANNQYTLQIQNNPDFSEVVAAWIDYNQDLTFSNDELLGQTTVTAGSTASINFTTPSNPSAGNTRLRVRMTFTVPVSGGQMDPCTSYQFGETEDYGVSFTSDPPGPPSGLNFSTICGLTTLIQDNACPNNTLSSVTVSGLGTSLGTGQILSSVDVVIDHARAADLDLFLETPNGTLIELSTDNGGSGADYGTFSLDSCDSFVRFTMASSNPIVSVTAPFSGNYLPEGDLALANDGSNPNGIWRLRVCDDQAGSTGTIRYFSVNFENVQSELPSCADSYNLDDAAQQVALNQQLSWVAGTGQPSGYDVYFGTSETPSLVSEGQASTSYNPGALQPLTTYYYQIVPSNSQGSAEGCPIRSFTTTDNSNEIVMVNGSVNACSGTFTDPGGVNGDYFSSDTLVFTIFPENPNSAVQVTFNSFELENGFDLLLVVDGADENGAIIGVYNGTNSPGTVTATNPAGALTFAFLSDEVITAPGWSATIDCVPLTGIPECANNLSPADGATGVLITSDINWVAGSANTEGYDVYFGTSSTPELVASGIATNSFDPDLAFNTTYFYQIVPVNANGSAEGCPVLSFSTQIEQDSTIWDVVVNSQVHNTLETLVTLAGLDGALAGPGPLTLFAPTDAAFTNLPQSVVDALVADPNGALTQILLYHVVGSQALSTDLSDGQQIVTLNGESVTVSITDGNVFINDAQVIIADILADNGVVHVIDAVLVPPTPEPAFTIWDVVVNSEVHNTLESLVLSAELDGALDDSTATLTLFAPTDAAFAALDPAVVAALTADPTGALAQVLLYHVVGSQALSTDLSDGQQIVTLNGESVTVSINDGNVFINDAQVIVADILADNGVVHVIDAVLVPPTPEPDSTVWDIVVNSEVHNTLESLVLLAELDGALDNIDASLTLFAPTDAAFAALDPAVVAALTADPTGALAQVLLYHVVGSQALSTDLSDGQQIVTLNGESVTVTIANGNVLINDALVIVRDILADNGVVHVIDAVLVPSTPEPDTTVWDIVVNSEVHNTLESLVLLAELDGALDNIDASLTLFAPTDAAFAALDPAVVAALTADPTGALAQVLLYHVVGSQALSTDLSDGQQVVTLNGESVTVTINVDGIFINDAQVIVRDILADNGVVHIIDAVLVPPTPEPDTTVWDIVVNSEVHNTLESLVLLAGLDGALDNIDASLTLFAPTDAAFEALNPALVDALVADPTGALAQVLLYHVVGSQALSTDLSDGQQIVTLNGESVTVSFTPDGLFINDAQVIIRDILADNGVVHVLDAVLLPPTPEPAFTIWDVVVNSEVHNTLEALVLAAELDGALDDSTATLTLFAPTDAAFAALDPAVVAALTADPTGALAQVLLYHVVGSQALSTDLSDGQQIVTLNGESVTVSITDGNVFINDAQVIVADILADNGVVHVIDAVLVPPTPEPDTTVWDIVVNSEVHNTLETLVELAGLDGALDNIDASLTLFAPTDAAFAALDPAVVAALTADPTGALAQVLLYHVVGAQALSTDLSDGQQIVTLNGESVTVTISGGNVFINDAQVIIADILADNGVVHVIDAVLVPPTPEPDTTVWDIVVNSEVHNTLESLVLLAELDGALDNIDASLTLFAPTDAALAALDPAVVAALTADPTGALAQVLLYHVVGSQALSTDLTDGQQIVTLNGESVTVSITDGNVFINDAQVIIADILADNGVVHVIDAVLVPPTPEPDTTVWDIVVNSEVHNTLETLVELAGLDGALDNIDASLTLFAPTDAAFAALDPAVVAALTADPTGALAQVLLYHVVGAQALSTDLSDGQQIVTLNGESVTVTISGGNVFINDAQVIIADILADNGVVHVIDAVLVPPTEPVDTVIMQNGSVTTCNGVFYDSGGASGDYQLDENFTLTINPGDVNSAVQVIFNSFNIEEDWDGMYVYDGPDVNSPLIASSNGPGFPITLDQPGAYWGTSIPGPFTSTHPTGALTFVFLSDDFIVESGWDATITCVDVTAIPGCAENLSPANAATDQSATNTTLSWSQGSGLVTGYDVYFGADCNSMTLVSENQTETTFDPGQLALNTSYAWMVVPTNANGPAEGCPCNTFTTSGITDILQSTAVINACAGNYYDTGGPEGDYSDNEISELTICPDQPNSAVEVTFSAFDVEDNTFTPTAPYDYLIIYNGTGTSGTSYTNPLNGTNQFSGTVNPGPFTSTATDGCLTFVFESDFSIPLSGWEASIGCVTTAEAPGCATNLAPADASVDVNAAGAVLSWSPGTGVATGYDVFFGADCNNMTLVSENQAGTTFNPGVLELNTSYAWMIVPTNSVGSAEGCPCNTFTTGGSVDILMQNGTFTTCAANFFDSAGPSANYANNENFTITFQPSQPNSNIQLTFNSFNTEANWDGIYVYNGPDVNSPLIPSANAAGFGPLTQPGAYWGTSIPGPFTSTHPTGALTIVFLSDGSFNNPGWDATISCINTSEAPGCATNLAPINTAVDVNAANPVLSWSPGTGLATGYDVFFGTDCNNMTLVSDNQVGTSFNPGQLDLNTSYAWMVVPSNSVGEAEGCPCNTFTTGGTIDILMQTATITTCSANFFDAQGPAANYTNNQNFTLTLQPDQPNASIQLVFNAFNTEANWDGIYVYNGPDVNSPLIASANGVGFGPMTQPGAWWGTTIPGPFTSTHPSGALTIVFLSDGSVVRPGWEATVACVNTNEPPSCATITSGPADGATEVCTNEAVFSWQMGSGAPATGYDVYLSQEGSPFLLFSDNQPTTTFDPGLLIANTNYSIVIVPTNAIGDAVGCDTISFTTGTCLNYCDAGATNCDEFISNVSLGSINNETGCGLVAGYSDYTSQSADLYIGTASTLTVTNGTLDWPQDQCGVWIDWNQDGDFGDANETITVTGTPGTGPYSAGIIPPADAVPGPTRMRVRITFTGIVDPCGTTTFGEVEDYTVVVNQPLACPFPNFVLISDITTTNAAAIWETVGTESQYLVRYRPQGSATTEATWANPIVVDAPATFTFLTDLEPCTNYVLQVASLCPDETDTTYSGDILFGTDCIVCEADFTAETEVCGANENGGCLVTPQAYQPISCGETICGTTSVTSPTVLDLDWYSFTVDNTADYTFKVLSEFLGDVFVINIENCSPTVIPIIGSTQFLPNNLQTFTTTLAPGTYAVVVQPNPDQTPFDCSSIYNSYTLELTGGSALIAPVSPVCGTSEPVSLFGIPAGGTWSGTGIVDGELGIFDPSTAGVGTFVITYVASGNGCPSEDTISIEVIDAPIVEFTGLAASYCPSDDVAQLNGIPAGGSFSINSTGGLGIDGSSFDPSAVEPGNYEITYSVVSSGTCVSENVQSVVVNTAPSVNFSLIDNTCSGNDPVSMDATPTGGTFTGSGVFGSTFDPSLASIGENSVTYSVSLPGETCPGTATEIIVVNPSPIVALSGLATTYCLSSAPVQLIGTPALGTFNGPGVTGSTFSPAAAGIGTHTIVYQFDNGTCVGFDQVIVTVTDNITLSINLPSTVCSNDDPFVLTSSPAGATFSGIGVFGQTFSPQAAGVGSHTITATYNTGTCLATVTQTITVNPAPTASFSYSANGANVSFSNGSVNATSYSWDFGDGQTSTATNPSHTYTTNGSYTITLVASSASCGSDTFTVTIELSVGIGSIEGVDMIQLYPNPTEGNVNLSFNSLLAQSFEVRITDAVGRLIESENVNNYTGKYAKVYSLENLADGVYTFTVSSEKGAVNFRVVKN